MGVPLVRPPHPQPDERHAHERHIHERHAPDRRADRRPAERAGIGGLDPVNTAFVIIILTIILAAVGYIVWTSL
ncbi:hypothetical protein HLK59_46240 [Streptomyces sp. S3(2020)]|nr:hypothetical protein [Streptomyces sp. S3(2020)]